MTTSRPLELDSGPLSGHAGTSSGAGHQRGSVVATWTLLLVGALVIAFHFFEVVRFLTARGQNLNRLLGTDSATSVYARLEALFRSTPTLDQSLVPLVAVLSVAALPYLPLKSRPELTGTARKTAVVLLGVFIAESLLDVGVLTFLLLAHAPVQEATLFFGSGRVEQFFVPLAGALVLLAVAVILLRVLWGMGFASEEALRPTDDGENRGRPDGDAGAENAVESRSMPSVQPQGPTQDDLLDSDVRDPYSRYRRHPVSGPTEVD